MHPMGRAWTSGEGHSDPKVENDRISTSQVPEPSRRNPGQVLGQFRVVESGISVHTAAMPHEICSMVHEGGSPRSHACRHNGDRRGTLSALHVASLRRVEVVPGPAPQERKDSEGSSGSEESNRFLVVSGSLCWRRDRRAQAVEIKSSPVDDDVRSTMISSRAARAEALVQMGELSAARQALEDTAVAPRDEARCWALQNPAKPPFLRDLIPTDIMNMMPVTPLAIDPECIERNLRSTRRGAAAGPLGTTADQLRIILESEHQDLARAQVPLDVLEFLRMGRLTAWQKPRGGVCGIVCGDVSRRGGSDVTVPVRFVDELLRDHLRAWA